MSEVVCLEVCLAAIFGERELLKSQNASVIDEDIDLIVRFREDGFCSSSNACERCVVHLN